MSQITNFPITVYGEKKKFSDTMTRGRCRVFHKGHNRNGTYITDDFAKKLIASAPYTPVKGIYDADCGDYADHGPSRDVGRIYGIVPADPNFAWESHEDFDGIVRDYACFDVLYYTALYGEASQIAGKGESMELYRGTLKGSWQYIEGKKAYVFQDGCFLGLQILGDEVEPCFEGASFYTQEESILALLEKYEKRKEFFQTPEQGGNIMNINFKLSDSQKHDILFNLLNPNFNEDGGWMVDYAICEVYEEYALAVNYAEGTFERVYYVKDDAEDKIEITSKERCYIVDVNTEERDALNNIRGEGTFAEAAASYAEATATIAERDATIAERDATINSLNTQVTEIEGQVATLTEEKQNYSIKVGELENNISTLTTERDEAQTNFQSVSEQLEAVNNELTQERENYSALQTSYGELQTNFANIETERNELANFKKDVLDNQKKNVISNYTELLDADVLATYTTNMDQYTAEELDMRLTYECKKVNPSIFSKNTVEPQPAYVPKDQAEGRGINDILARYEKK